MGTKLLLFSRPDCHLCEHAAELAQRAGAEIEYRDISGDLALLASYGSKIPVLKHPGSGREIAYPFDAPKLEAWLDACG